MITIKQLKLYYQNWTLNGEYSKFIIKSRFSTQGAERRRRSYLADIPTQGEELAFPARFDKNPRILFVCLFGSGLASKPAPSRSFPLNMAVKWRRLPCVLHSLWRSNHPTGGRCSMVPMPGPMRLYMNSCLFVCLCGSGIASKPVQSRKIPYKHGGRLKSWQRL